MRRWGTILCLFFLLHCDVAMAQQPQYAFRVSFSDKQGSPSLSNPLAFLSQRALDRRTAQGIAVDATDQPVSPDYIDSVLTITGGKMHLTSRWLNHCVILLEDSSKILLLQGKPYVTTVRYVGYYPTGLHNKTTGGNEKFASESQILPTRYKTTGDAAYYGWTFTQTQLVNGDFLHDRGYKGKGKLIAVLDEGFSWVDANAAFDSLNQSGRLIDKYNFVLANNDVFNFSLHGTNSLSTMAVNMPGIYVGAAPDAEYAIYITEYRFAEQEVEMDHLLAASERADSLGADIITESLGYNIFNNPVHYSLTYADIDGKSTVAAKAANMAASKGIIFVASAGNEGGNSWNYILTPGDADSALTIGSVDAFKSPAGNSGYGPNSSGRIKPDVCLMGQSAAVIASGTGPITISGTSVATPQLAGWAACLWQSAPSNNAYRIRRAIVESAHIYTTPDNHLGYGVPDFKKAMDLLGVKDTPAFSEWIEVAPNPFIKSLDIRINQPQQDDVMITLTSIEGRVIIAEQKQLKQGQHVITLDTPELPAGIYFLKITSPGKKAVLKLVKN